MAVLTNQNVLFVWSNYQPKNCWVWLQQVGGWRRIRPDNADACTNLIALAASARATNRFVDVEIDDATNLIQYITLK
jgi:hypothetical protein